MNKTVPKQCVLPSKKMETNAGVEEITPLKEDQKWLERIAKSWTAPDWPAEYGGGGLNKAECKVLREEMARIQAHRLIALVFG